MPTGEVLLKLFEKKKRKKRKKRRKKCQQEKSDVKDETICISLDCILSTMKPTTWNNIKSLDRNENETHMSRMIYLELQGSEILLPRNLTDTSDFRAMQQQEKEQSGK